MDTFSFGFLPAFDDSVGMAREEFERKEYARAISSILGLPTLFQSRPDVLELKARSHQALGQFPRAIADWEHLLRVDPLSTAARSQLPICYSGLGSEEVFKEPKALFKASKFLDTIEALDGGPREWRKHTEFHRMRARSHEALNQYGHALNDWRQVVALASSNEEAHVHIADCHAHLGNLAEAERAFVVNAQRYPTNMYAQFQLLFSKLRKADSQGGMSLVIAEFERLKAISGNSAPFRIHLDSFRTKLLSLYDGNELLALDIGNVLQLAPVVAAAARSLRSIYEHFEPVGNNCEFGFAQRNHGAEPLSLFRWTSITPENLVRLLRDRLEQYEVPDRYRVEQGRSGEFILKENVYHSASHTSLKVPDISAEALLGRLSRRQGFLKRKFLETAAEGSKCFVYKYDQRLSADTMDAIQQGLSELGVRKLLFAMHAEGGDQAGTIRIDNEERVTGFLSDFFPNTQFEQWDSIVEHAHAYFERH